jgi:hypothetical protein
MENVKEVLVKILKFIIIAATLLAMIGLVMLFIKRIEVFPYYFEYKNEFRLLLIMYICYLWSNKYEMKKVKTLSMIGMCLSAINLAGFRLLIRFGGIKR